MEHREKNREKLIYKIRELCKTLIECEESEKAIREDEQDFQKKLIEYEKLSALGRLTANVAHEIRNPIMVIGGLTERLKKNKFSSKQQKEYLKIISSEAKKLEQILKEVLIFSREPFFKREEQDINKLVEKSLNIYRDAFNKFSIKVQKFFHEVPSIFIDKRHVIEAINNLISNAIDAMPKGGSLTVTTGEDYLSGKNYVTLEIKDSGTGIPKENLLMIFEPFFSTKVTKRETGLGLPITKKIVETHGGFIKLDSSVGKGSVFTIFFPYRTR